MARRIGYAQEDLDALVDPQGSDRFTEDVKAALLYARRMTGDAHEVTGEVFSELKRHFTDKQVLELTCVVGLANYFNRLTTALRIDLSGTDEPYDPEETDH